MHKNAKQLAARALAKQAYQHSLRQLQIVLVKLQRHFIRCGDKILIVLEGRGRRRERRRDQAHRATFKSARNPCCGPRQTLRQWKASALDDQALKKMRQSILNMTTISETR